MTWPDKTSLLYPSKSCGGKWICSHWKWQLEVLLIAANFACPSQRWFVCSLTLFMVGFLRQQRNPCLSRKVRQVQKRETYEARKGHRQRHASVYVMATLRESFPTFLLQFLYQAWQVQKQHLQWSPGWRYFWSQCLVWTNIQGIKKKTYNSTERNISSSTFVKAYRLHVNKIFIPVSCFRTDPIRVQTFPVLINPVLQILTCRRCADMWEWRDVLKI